MLTRILDFFWRPCPSGLPHRVRYSTVKNWLGKEYCWHPDCMRTNFAECGVNSTAGVPVVDDLGFKRRNAATTLGLWLHQVQCKNPEDTEALKTILRDIQALLVAPAAAVSINVREEVGAEFERRADGVRVSDDTEPAPETCHVCQQMNGFHQRGCSTLDGVDSVDERQADDAHNASLHREAFDAAKKLGYPNVMAALAELERRTCGVKESSNG